jgi:O-antigen/teichoic acid export membrane protein
LEVFDLISDIKRLVRHTGIYSIGNIVVRLGAFALLPLYTHYLSVADFGILALLNSISAIVSSFLGIGIAHATLRFYFEFENVEDGKAVVSTALITTMAICSLSVLILSLFSPRLSKFVFLSESYAFAINVTYVSLVFEMMRQVGLAYMRARELSVLFVGVSLLQLLVQVGFNVYFLTVSKLGVSGVVLGNTFSVLSGLLVCGVLVVRECGIRYHYRKMKMMLAYSYPFLFSSVAGVVLQNADRFILTSLFSLEAVGIYSLGLKFSALLTELVIEPFQRSFGAFRFSIMKQGNAKEIQAKTLNYLFLIVCWSGLFISIFAGQIVKYLATPEYYGVVKYVPFLVLIQIVGSTSYVFQTGILFAKSTSKLFYISTFSGVFGVLASYPFIYFMGIAGACLALFGRCLVSVVMTYRTSQKIYSVDYDFKTVAISVAVTIALYLLSLSPTGSTAYLSLVYKTIVWLAFPLVLYKLGIFSADEKEIVLELAQKIGLQGLFQKARGARSR